MKTTKEKIQQLRDAITEVRGMNLHYFRKHGSERGGNGMTIHPDGTVINGASQHPNGIHIVSLRCNWKRDAIDSLKEEIDYTKKYSDPA